MIYLLINQLLNIRTHLSFQKYGVCSIIIIVFIQWMLVEGILQYLTLVLMKYV